MARSTTSTTDAFPIENESPAMQRMILEERWHLQIARALYELREEAGLSIREVAMRAGVPVATVRRLEDADPRWVSLTQFFRVVRAMGGRLTIEQDNKRLKSQRRNFPESKTKRA